ncbi:uncharacterized protein LOC110854115 [Folsomia candida]|uniref:uncharacterized protein LOC110854115 n=1 Tax=Folsomia candida TaxID=158441 RepID=UPI001604DDE9|nr:uncharacterized protein LOC110854115 [Folsomia candida]
MESKLQPSSKFGAKVRHNSQRRVHQTPLGFATVRQRICTFLSVEDLKATRYVNQAWHSDATFELSTRIQPILLHTKADCKNLMKVLEKSCAPSKKSRLCNIHPLHAFAFFASFPEDPPPIPYKTGILDYMHSKYRNPRQTWEEYFFTTYGAQITELKFIQFNLYTEKALREFREMLSTSCPQLSILTLQFQKDPSSSSSYSGGGGSGTSSTSTPTPSPSPSPQMIPGAENVFFPTEESLRKTLVNLKKFTFTTDNKCFMNKNALEEFMALMPSLQEFTYRYTGAKKQWTLVRRVDIIDILCNIMKTGHYSRLTRLDLDSDGTVLSGEDFRKISTLKLREELKLRSFSAQVFIKTEPDWEYLCAWLYKLGPSLVYLDLQVRTHFPQLLSEQELPWCFPRVGTAKLLLDSNLKTFLRRMPNVKSFIGVYDNELLPLSESSCGGYSVGGGSGGGGGCASSYDESESTTTASSSSQKSHHSQEHNLNQNNGNEVTDAKDGPTTIEDITTTTQSPHLTKPSITTPNPVANSFDDYDQLPSCPTARHLRILGNDEFGLDVEWKSRVFCNITSFETDIYFDEDLRLIWLHMQRIRRLVLHIRTKVCEQAFTGAGVLALTPSRLKHAGEEEFQSAEHLAKLEEYPHLGLLRGLETFEILTGSRQDAYGSQFSASLIIYGVGLLDNLKRLVLPPAITPICLEESLGYLSKLRGLTYLSVTDDTFKSVLPFHMLKMDLPNLEIVVRYYQSDSKRQAGNFWRLERFPFPDFLPDRVRRVNSMEKRHSTPS